MCWVLAWFAAGVGWLGLEGGMDGCEYISERNEDLVLK